MSTKLAGLIVAGGLSFLATPFAFGAEPAKDVKKVDQSSDIPARTVFFELNTVTGALGYDIQVKAVTQRWAEPYTSNLKGNTLRLRLTPGNYLLRTRSVDGRGHPGRWSSWSDFWVHFRAPTKIFPADGMTIEPKGDRSQKVTFEWPAQAKSKMYLFTLFDQTGEVIEQARTKQTWMASNLQLSAAYSWSVIPLVDEHAPIPKVTPMYKFAIGIPDQNLKFVRVEIAERPLAASYDFEFVRLIGETETDDPAVYNAKSPMLRVALAPGEYEMRARTNYKDGVRSNWTPPNRFRVRSPNPVRLALDDNEDVDANGIDETEIQLAWKPVKSAKRYQVMLWTENDLFVDSRTTTGDSIRLEVGNEHRYKWTVFALQDREPTRDPDKIKPGPSGWKGGRRPAGVPDGMKLEEVSSFSIGRFTKKYLSAADEPSHFYGWGKYLMSNASYVGRNYDNVTRISQNMIGGTGEVALGYWGRKHNFGILGAASSTGITVDGKVNYYNYGSVMLGYQTLSKMNRTRWRVYTGLAYKETPEILAQLTGSDFRFSTVKAWAPEIRLSYLGEINTKVGYHLYGSYLHGLQAISTPNGLPLKELYHAEIGTYLTYHYSAQLVGQIGYSYQIDSMAYRTSNVINDGFGDKNNSKWSGHFLSMSLQFGFGR